MNSDSLKLLDRCQLLVKIIGIFIVIASMAVIFGSYYHITLLTSISPVWVNMKVNTAICFWLSGFALLLSNKKNPNYMHQMMVIILSIALLLINSMTIVEYLFGIDFGIDQFILKDSQPLFLSTLSPGRMAIITAINFMLTAMIFLLLLKKSISIWVIHTGVWVILLIAFISLCNYIYLPNMHYAVVKYTLMAIHTNVLFLLLGLGFLLLKPTEGIIEILLKKSTGGYLLRYLLPVMIIVPLLVGKIGNHFETQNLWDNKFGGVIMSITTFIIVGLFVLIMAKIIDRKEKDVASAELQISRNELIFQQFADNIDIVFYTTSPDLSKILYVSPAYEQVWGRSTDSLYQNPRAWFEAILPEDQPIAHQAFFIDLQKKNASVSAEYRIQRPDGSIRYVFSRVHQLRDAKNNVHCIIGITVDMTNVTLEKTYKQLQNNILHLIENERTIEAFSPKLLQLVCHALNFDLGELWFFEPSSNRLRCIDTWHKESRLISNFDFKSRQQTLSITDDFSGKIWKTKQPLWMSKYADNIVFTRAEAAKMAGLNSALGIPILYHDHIYGIIEFLSFDIREPEPELLTMMENIGRSIGEFAEHFQDREHIKEIERHDLLTGLLNRSAFEVDLDKLIADKKTMSITVMVLDIDRLTLVNETFGHAYGDILLKNVASRFGSLSAFKKMSLSRLGGDKFIFYLPEMNRKEAYDFARIIQLKFNEPYELAENKVALTASIGIALYPQDGLDSKTLMVNADLALVEAKQLGGNQIYFFTNELAVISSKTIQMDTELRRAILDNEFVLNYQPQVDLKTNTICAAEVLVRWQHPVDGLILPNDFIPYAEKNNLIIALNEHVTRLAFQNISTAWSGVPLSINISAQQFKEAFHLVDYLESLMKEFAVSAQHIELEITENMLLNDTEHNLAILTALNQLGFQIAIDDFGTGFSSFSYIKRLPIYKIKIDKSYITGLPKDTANAQIVRAMIQMAHSLDKIVVAEGAETKAEVDFLKREKCDIVQGFYYFKPMSFDAFTALAKKT